MCFFQQQPLKMVYDFAIFFEDINLLTLLQSRSCMEYRKKNTLSQFNVDLLECMIMSVLNRKYLKNVYGIMIKSR